MNIVLDFDDFHPKSPENCIDDIDKLVDACNDIKITLFTTPRHSGISMSNDVRWCDRVREHIANGNVRLGIHGYEHSMEEFKHISMNDTYIKLYLAMDFFDIANLPYVKIFKGPNWGISQNTITALKEAGFTHLYNHDDYKHLDTTGLKTVYYNWNLKDNAPEDLDTYVAHGHTWNVCGNGIQEVSYKILSFIDKFNPTFKFGDEI